MYTYDTIPFKLYFKVIESGDLSVLGENAESILKEINDKRDSGGQKKTKSKELDIYSQIERLSVRYKSIKLAIYYLRQLKDDDLIEMIKSNGYKFGDDLQESLNDIENIIEGLLTRIEIVKNRLPKKKETESKDIPLDEVILSYCALLEMGFVDTNAVTLSQYDSIITLGNKKMDALNKSQDGRK